MVVAVVGLVVIICAFKRLNVLGKYRKGIYLSYFYDIFLLKKLNNKNTKVQRKFKMESVLSSIKTLSFNIFKLGVIHNTLIL